MKQYVYVRQYPYVLTTARVVKLVDTRDLKSLGLKRPCRFKSGPGYQDSAVIVQNFH